MKPTHSYNEHNGCEITALVKNTKVGKLQSFYFKIVNERTPMYTMGQMDPISFVRGKRDIRGSLVFSHFDKDTLSKASELSVTSPESKNQMPPLTIRLKSINDHGSLMEMCFHNVVVKSNGSIVSIEDLKLHTPMDFVCSKVAPWKECAYPPGEKSPLHTLSPV